MFEQRCQLAGRGVVEGTQRAADGAGDVADEPAGGLYSGRVALVFEAVAEWPEAGPELTRGGEVGVVNQQAVQLDALLGDDRGRAPDDGADAGGERGEGECVPAVEERRAVGLDQLVSGNGVAAGVLEAGDARSLQLAELCGGELDPRGAREVVVAE